MHTFGGRGKTQNRNKSRFSTSANLLIFLTDRIYSAVSCVNEVTVLRSTEERVARTSCLSVKRDVPPWLPPNEGPFSNGPYLLRYGTHLHKTGHSAVENYSGVRKRRIVAKKKMLKCVNRSDYSKLVGGQNINLSKNSEKVWIVSGYF